MVVVVDTLDFELTPEAPRVGKDELNLAEFPFAMLHSRPPRNAPLTLEFRDGEKEWIVEGSSKYGLPLAPDIQVYVVLMELTREQAFPVQVEFCRRDLIKRLGWDPNGRSYDRLTLAFDRLVGVTIRSRNAFYDAQKRRWSSKEAFHVLERYRILDGTLPGQAQPTLFPSWIRWSPELYANMAAGYIKSLDVDLFLSLRSSISQALYRFLDKKRGGDGKPMFRMALKTLVFEHLGMSRTYFPSEAKHKLKPAHSELLAVGFLSGVEYAPMKNGEEMVVYRFGNRSLPARARPAALPPRLSPLAQRLVEAGLARQAAQELGAADPAECERQLGYLPHREARDPGALLGKAIREGWGPPPGWRAAQKRREALEEARRTEEAAAAAAEQKQAEESAFDRWWAGLPAEKQAAVTAAAYAELRRRNSVVFELTRTRPDSPLLLAALRPLLKKLSGWMGTT